MSKNRFRTILALVFILSFVPVARGQMQSINFRITTSAMSGGGAPMAADNYNTESTLGQSSPLMDPLDPSFSDTYDLYPGFWYVIAAFESTCPGDFNGDKDVDGSDLADYIFEPNGLGLDEFALNFGKENCP
jgi:hypothetical protein